MEKFLDKLLKLIQEETDNPNSPIFTKRIECIVKIIPTKKIPGSDGFIGEFYKTFKE